MATTIKAIQEVQICDIDPVATLIAKVKSEEYRIETWALHNI